MDQQKIRLARLSLAVTAALALAACSAGDSDKDAIADTMSDFLKAARAGDAAKACGHMTKVYRDADCVRSWSSDKSLLETLGGATFKVERVDKRAGEATVEVSLKSGASGHAGEWKLIKADKHWEIAEIGSGPAG
ncbi:hypothetical protein J4573_28030 [Actinomadura barringtoniae]|uniref:DUF4878 domain-containing protein n=1 Tax=Actinomadura barringtoniae TaxID=1427535 RepID=A0A939PLY4_9ACTN|nr:hypothetical protein [Actinomadura barringtoniae]MBO2450976.1 hypothetical protein [Actinomadura barringtoniae]